MQENLYTAELGSTPETPQRKRWVVGLFRGLSLTFYTVTALSIIFTNLGLIALPAWWTIVTDTLAIAFLFPIASNKSLYWTLGLWLIPWSLLSYHWIGSIVIALGLLYTYSLFLNNNINRVSEEKQVWLNVFGALFMMTGIMTFYTTFIFPSGLNHPTSFDEIPVFAQHASFCLLWVVKTILFLIANFCIVLSPLYDGRKPAKDDKVDFSPLNKYFIAGVIIIAMGVMLIWWMFRNFEAINDFF